MLNELTVVDAKSRKRLEQSIPTNGEGETCIGCGVRLALQVRDVSFVDRHFYALYLLALLKYFSVHHQVLRRRNGIMVLVTDGQNTEPGQFISDVQAEVVEAGTKVVAVGFGYAFIDLSGPIM